MEYKINMTKLFKLLREFTSDNFSYNQGIGTIKVNDNLSNYYKERLNRKSDEFMAYLENGNFTCTTQDINIRFLTVKDELLEVEFNFTLEKQQQSVEFEEYNCKLKLISKEDDYEIKEIALFNKEGVTNYGFHLVDLLKKRLRIAKPEGNKITLAISIRNEADKFIRRMLTHAMQYVSNIVILDDASTDNTVEVCEEVLKDFPHKIYLNDEPMVQNLKESECKEKLWNLAIKEQPDWILLLDGDELFEDWGIQILPVIVNDINYDTYYFKIYHMWEDEEHYRVDGLWKPVDFRIYLLRYQPNYEYEWYHMGLHSYRHPVNVYDMPGCFCYVRLRHYGHFTKEIRRAKYEKYKLLDPKSEFVPKEHYDSILEDNPVLEKF